VWEKKSAKSRTNLILRTCGLEATFAPRVVLETLVEGKDGLVSVCTGRDGRILWSGKTKFLRHTDPGVVKRKFSSFRLSDGPFRARCDYFSYLVSVLSQTGIPRKGVEPLVRLSLKLFDLSLPAVRRIGRKILSCLETKFQVRRKSVAHALPINPYLTGKVIKSRSELLVSVPLWDWRPVKGLGFPVREPA
jgi:hypothetical protein